MPTLVSHPDEVKVLSKRFGMGAANIDRYLELDGYKATQKAIATQMQTELWQQVPYIPLGVIKRATVYRKNLTGLLTGGVVFTNVRRAV